MRPSFLFEFLFYKAFLSNHPFRQVILLEASIQLKYYAAVQVAQVFDPVSLHAIRPWPFPVRCFSYQLPYFSNFKMCHLVSSPTSISFFLNQYVFFLCVTAWSHISLQKHLLSSAAGITRSLRFPSNSLNNLFWFDSNNRLWFCSNSN